MSTSDRTSQAAPRTHWRVVAAVAGFAALAGCGGPRFDTSNDYSEIYPITVSTQPILVTVPAAGALSDREAAEVDALGRDYLHRGTGRITVAYPNDVDATEIVSDVTRRLRRVGVPLRAIRRGAYDAASYEGDGVVLSFEGPVATAPGCPDLWGDSRLTAQSGYSARTGCATQANLAAMISDPRDLVRPRPLAPAHAGRGLWVQEAYARGDATGRASSVGDATTTD